jgi:hypothetical protein
LKVDKAAALDLARLTRKWREAPGGAEDLTPEAVVASLVRQAWEIESLPALADLRQIVEIAASHPLLRGLLRDLPKAQSRWSKEQQQQWLDLAASMFPFLYEEPPGEES